MSYVALDEIFFRQLCKMSFRFANPTFLRRLKRILKRCSRDVFYHCLENYLAKMSKNCLCEMSYIPLYEMPFRQLCKISSRFAKPTLLGVWRTSRLKDILQRCLNYLLNCLHTEMSFCRHINQPFQVNSRFFFEKVKVIFYSAYSGACVTQF